MDTSGKQSKWLRGLSPDLRQDGKGQSPEREKMWRGPALDWLFTYGVCSKATVVPRGQLGLDEDRIEEMVPEPFWVTLCPFPCPGGSEPGRRKGTSTPPLAQALSASPLFLSVADLRACRCCSAVLDFPYSSGLPLVPGALQGSSSHWLGEPALDTSSPPHTLHPHTPLFTPHLKPIFTPTPVQPTHTPIHLPFVPYPCL